MRAYFWGNLYLSSIQQGIQAAHVVGDMIANYDESTPQNQMLVDWARHHKTMVLYNGGFQSKLIEISNIFADSKKYPWARFHEEEDSLNGSVTCVGIIVPDYITRMVAESREKKTGASKVLCGFNNDSYVFVNEAGNLCEISNVTDTDIKIADLIANSRLAS